MKKTLLLLFVIVQNAFAQPSIQWQKCMGGSGEEKGRQIKQTADGGYIIAGSTRSNDNGITNHTNSSGNTTFDYWVVKTNAAGDITWQKAFGGSNEDLATSVLQTSDGGYIVTGKTLSNDGDVLNGGNGLGDYLWTIKIDSVGVIQWQHTATIAIGCTAYDVKQTSDGGYILTGDCYAALGTFSYGDSFIMKLSNTGIFQWQTLLGGDYHDNLSSVQQTADGGYIAAGNTFSRNGIFSANHGTDYTTCDYWIVKLDVLGTIQWQKLYGGDASEEARTVLQTTDGNYIVSGYTDSNNGDVTNNHQVNYSDFWVLKLDPLGNLLWQKCFGGSGNEYARSIIQTNDNQLAIVGTTRYSVPTVGVQDGDISFNYNWGTTDIWMIKIDLNGTLVWEKCIGGSSFDLAYSLVQTTDNGYALCGETFSTDGDITSPNAGGYDFCVVKLNAASLSTPTFTEDNIILYPNPAESNLYIQLASNDIISKVIVTDLTGKIVLESTGNGNELNIESLASGTFIITITTENNEHQRKLIKK